MYFIYHDIFKGIQRYGIYYIDNFLNEVTIYLCAGTKERKTFAPAHLQAVGDHKFDVINIINMLQLWDNITKIEVILFTNIHAPESIFDVELGEYER